MKTGQARIAPSRSLTGFELERCQCDASCNNASPSAYCRVPITRMASAFTGQPVSGTAAAIAIAPAMIAYSAAIVSNARLVERRVKRDILVPPSVNELALRDDFWSAAHTGPCLTSSRAKSDAEQRRIRQRCFDGLSFAQDGPQGLWDPRNQKECGPRQLHPFASNP